jgi:tetratricopeptide (TPR) repeat protein
MTRCSATVRGLSLTLTCLLLAGCFPPPGTSDQSQAERFYGVGKTRVQQQDFKGAVAAYEQALQSDPNLAKAHYDLGMVFERELSSPEKALYHYIRALELDPDFQGADLISNRLSTVRMQLGSSATPSFASPQLAAEIQRLQIEMKTLQEERNRLFSQNAELKDQLAALTQQPPVSMPSNRVAQGTTAEPQESRGTTARTPPTTTVARTYVIQRGDTLFGVSRRHQVSQQSLLAANPGLSAGNFPLGRTIAIPAN